MASEMTTATARFSRERARGRQTLRWSTRWTRVYNRLSKPVGLWRTSRRLHRSTGLYDYGNGYSCIACNPISIDAIYSTYHTLLSGPVSSPAALDRL